MTDVGGRRQAASSDNSLVEEISPYSAWSEDSSYHYLVVDVPENSNTENISGRYEGEILYVIVPKLVKDKEREPLSPATDDDIRGKKHEHKHDQEDDKKHKRHQEDDKKHKRHQEEQDEKHEHVKEEHGHISHHGQNDDNKKVVKEGGFQEVPTATWPLEGGILGSVMEILSMNKGIAVTAVLAFALGVLLSQKFQSNAGSEGGLPPM
ncbi:hypothetical protein RHGRI_034863 [Rhododendron griersonianum]|uniref:SHSP domain-containing protein n=1 Tax=Rhododendron griersonianum TaxID=479676 RepID=A0AAV6I367_9ERIC|nr:hypothetical protein RHGRI_034863 [Rhododendron griersonianum]